MNPIIINDSAIHHGRKETKVKCASYIRRCYCLSIIKTPAVSLHHFDTIVENGMLWESPGIKIAPFMRSHLNALFGCVEF